jgi:hypothetical protein
MKAVQLGQNGMRWAIPLFCGVLSLFPGLPSQAFAQVPDSVQVADSVLAPVDTLAPPGQETSPGSISGRGAFLRSALIPGWGHAKVGAFARGAFYFSAQSSVAFMVFKTQSRINRTDKRIEVRESAIRARLIAQGNDSPEAIEQALEDDETVADLRLLRETRAEQREDWLALGIFLMLIGGADAYVSSHLTDFPTAVVIEPTPDGGVEVSLSLPVGF